MMGGLMGESTRLVKAVTQDIMVPADAEVVIDFLVGNEWPFHGTARLTRQQAATVAVSNEDVTSFWVRSEGHTVGLLRAFDLSDLASGSPLIDIRIVEDGLQGAADQA